MIATDVRICLRASLARIFAIGILVSAGAGCGGGKGTQAYPDAMGLPGTGGRPPTDAGATGTGGNMAVDAGTTDGPAATTNIRLLTGPAALVSPGPACSDVQVPTGTPKPDQWCGVIKPGAVTGTISLSVFNLTKAIAGTALTCTAGDTNCLLLSGNLSIATDAAPGFFGDTLIYYEAQSVLAWRPGWTAGRVLVAHDQLTSCAAGAATAICIKATANAAVLNLYADRIDTQTGAPLTLIEPIDATVGNLGFSVDLLSVLWSTRTAATAPEVLKIQTIGDAATRRTVATNVTAWSQSPDGARWLWLSQPVVDPISMATTGILQTAPFPSGTAPSNVHTDVVQYASWAANSVMVLATPAALGYDLKAISNSDNPVATATVIEAADVLGFSDLTADGTVLYTNDFVQPDPLNPNNVLVNLFTSKADATGKCTVTALTEANTRAYLTRSSLGVGWVHAASPTATVFEGRFTTLATCTTATFSTTLSGYLETSAGVVLLENYNMAAFTAALGLVPYAANGTVGARIPIHSAANPDVMPLFPDTPRVVFSVNQTLFEGGIYVSAPLAGVAMPFVDVSANAALGTAATDLGVFSVPALAAASRALRTSVLPKRWGTRSPVMIAGHAAATATRARPLWSTSPR
jgi:hypothetical protein